MLAAVPLPKFISEMTLFVLWMSIAGGLQHLEGMCSKGLLSSPAGLWQSIALLEPSVLFEKVS